MSTTNPSPDTGKPSKAIAVGIFLAQTAIIWAVVVVGCIVFDHFKRPWNTPLESFKSIALPGVIIAPVFCWRIRRLWR